MIQIYIQKKVNDFCDNKFFSDMENTNSKELVKSINEYVLSQLYHSVIPEKEKDDNII